ncbi:NitT/TauT family transport system permease protein [Herbinix hemicellulosilytica]|uniref:Putative membrane protein n=1 Tax=Herbinix hemicellulosilytica TaxID=1564487 RepID=A0A0H5STJ3_HERHM|nr:ABC transporter permease [Herbinix hemicellulosilytica]RBP60250.1 NitT/TauT family transport system permease protein [Herbinix hemicellulosilytica]CRZ33608.1 putative membrane protein [Herbinix hemicellulosilytica]
MNRKTKKVESESITVSAAQKEFLRKHLIKKRRIRFFQIILLIGFIAFWEVGTYIGIVDPFIFSSPSRIIKTIFEMAVDGVLFYHIGITLLETIISFALVNIIGLAVAIILWWNDSISKVLEPYLIVLNSLPKSALAPVFIVWLGNNMKTIIIAAISVALFGSIITMYTDFKTVEEDKIKLIYTLGGNKKDVLIKVVLPANIPSMISLMKVNIGLSLVGVIIGEFLAAKAGLGYLIIYGSQVFKLNWVIMSIVILCIIATGLYKLLTYFEKKYSR